MFAMLCRKTIWPRFYGLRFVDNKSYVVDENQNVHGNKNTEKFCFFSNFCFHVRFHALLQVHLHERLHLNSISLIIIHLSFSIQILKLGSLMYTFFSYTRTGWGFRHRSYKRVSISMSRSLWCVGQSWQVGVWKVRVLGAYVCMWIRVWCVYVCLMYSRGEWER